MALALMPIDDEGLTMDAVKMLVEQMTQSEKRVTFALSEIKKATDATSIEIVKLQAKMEGQMVADKASADGIGFGSMKEGRGPRTSAPHGDG